MEALVRASSSAVAHLASISKSNDGFAVIGYRNPCLVFASGFSSPSPNSKKTMSLSRARRSVTVEAKKYKSKPDTHSFVPKPNEATGPFPEAVLLKQRKIQEDGSRLPEFADTEEAELFEYLRLQVERDLNVETMRHYEVVYLVHENYAEEVSKVNEKIIDFMREKRAKIWRLNDWGMRRLAYKIKKAKNAHYTLMNFELDAKWINDFKSLLDKDERVIRHLVMKRDHAETKDCPPPPEFHSLRAGMDNEDDHLDDDQNEADLDSEDWDDEDEANLDGKDRDGENDTELDGYDDIDVEDGIVAADDDDNEAARSNDSSSVSWEEEVLNAIRE